MTSLAEIRKWMPGVMVNAMRERMISRTSRLDYTQVNIEREEVSLEGANRLNREGGWREAAEGFNAVMEKEAGAEGDAAVWAEVFMGRCQMLINLGCLGQARGDLEKGLGQIVERLESDDSSYFLARREEKLAWIADYTGDFDQAIWRLNTAGSYVRQIPQSKRGEREAGLLSTTVHFLGRAHYGLARQGVNVLKNIGQARGYFEEDLRRFEGLRETGRPAWANEGFGHLWLARCDLELVKRDPEGGRKQLLMEKMQKARRCWKSYLEGRPEDTIMGHYHLLEGEVKLVQGEPETARENFEKAGEMWKQSGEYSRGMARALLGIAETWAVEGKWGAALKYVVEAVRLDKTILLKPF